jgi:hypothetical protein
MKVPLMSHSGTALESVAAADCPRASDFPPSQKAIRPEGVRAVFVFAKKEL